jgi:uncharacterized protein YrrD
MDISINAKVFCSDGECGHVSSVLIDPIVRKVTHLIVKERGFLGQERMVPVELIHDSHVEKIQLSIDRETFHALENFLSFKYVRGEDPFEVYMPQHYYLHPYMLPDSEADYEPDAYYTRVENIPPNELAIRHGADVYARDGHIGKVDELLVSPTTEKISHIVLQERHLWDRKHISIPVSEIERIEVDGIYLNLTIDEVDELPAIAIQGL